MLVKDAWRWWHGPLIDPCALAMDGKEINPLFGHATNSDLAQFLMSDDTGSRPYMMSLFLCLYGGMADE